MASVAKREWEYKGVKKSAWVVRYVDQGGKHRSKQFDKKKDADTYKRQVENEMDAGTHIAAGDGKTVKQVCEMFLRHQEDRARDGRISRNRLIRFNQEITDYFIGGLGAKLYHELKQEEIEAIYQTMIRLHGHLPSTAKARIQQFKMVEDYARKRKLTKNNPIADALKELRGVIAKPIRTFTDGEFKALMKEVSKEPPKSRRRSGKLVQLFVNIAAFCGLRIGEILALTRTHIDLTNGVIHVRHSVTTTGELKRPKTDAGIRDVPLPSHIVKQLSDWLDDGYVQNEREVLFLTSHAGFHDRGHFHRNYWTPVLKRAGLWVEGGDNHHFHALRHHAASSMIENQIPITDVASLLGHKSFDMTLQVYAHPTMRNGHRVTAIQGMADKMLKIAGL